MTDIDEAKRLLKENGWIAIKFDKRTERDADECVEMKARGQDKPCFGCSCNICARLKS